MKRMKLQVILFGMLVMLCSALSLLAYTFFNIEKKILPISAVGGGTASLEEPAQGVVSAFAETNDGISLLAGEELLDALKFEMYAGSDPTADELIPASEYTVTKSDNTYTVTMTYSGSARYFFVWDYHSSKFTGKKVGSNISLYNSNDEGYVGTTVPANASTYSSALTLTLKAGFAWSDGSTDPLVFNYVVKPMVVDVPVLDKCEGGTGASDDPFYFNRVYNGENKSDTMTIMGYNEFAMTPKYSSSSHWTWDATGSKLVASNSLLQHTENSYPFRFALKSTSNFVWSTGDTADKYFQIRSTVQPITLPELVGAELRDDGYYHLDVPYTGAIYSGKIYADDTYHVKTPAQPSTTSSHSGGYTNIDFHDDPVKSYYTFDTTFTVTLTEGTDRWLWFNLYDTNNQCWADATGKPTTDTERKTYIVHFVEREMNLPKLVGHDASNDFTKHVEYTGAPFTFTFEFDDTVIADYASATTVQDRLTFTITYQSTYWASSDTVFTYDETTKKGTITITLTTYGMDPSGKYIQFRLRNTASTHWKAPYPSADGNTAHQYFYFYVTASAVTIPTVMDDPLGQKDRYTYQYDGEGFTFYLYTPDNRVNLSSYNSDYFEDAVYDDAKKAYKITVKQAAAVVRTLSFRVNLNATGSMRWANDDGTPSEDSAYKVIYVVITYAAVTIPTMMDNPLGQDNRFIYEYTGQGFDVYLYTPDNRVYLSNYNTDYFEDPVYDDAKKAYKVHIKQAAAVVRSLTFRVYLNTSSMRWANDDGTPSEDGAYKLYYVEIVRKKMPTPVLEGADATNPFNRTVEYSPTAQIALKINQIPTDAFSISRSSVGQTSWEGDEFLGWITAGASISSDYTVTVTPKANWSWADGSTDAKVYHITIEPLSIKRPTLVGADADNPLKQTFVYDYGVWPELTLQFEDGFGSSQITSTSTTNTSSVAYFKFTWATSTGTLTVQANSASGTAATGQATTSGRTFTVAPTSNYLWEDDRSSTPMTFTMAVVKRAVKIPVLVGADENDPYLKTFSYDDIDGFTFVFNDADQNNLNYKVDEHWSLNSWENNTLSVTRQQALATSCPVTISLKNTSYMYWDETGSPTAAKNYAIGVGRYTVAAPVIKGEYVGSGTSADPFRLEYVYDANDYSIVVEGVDTTKMKYTANTSYWKDVTYDEEAQTLTLTRKSQLAGMPLFSFTLLDTAGAEWSTGVTGAIDYSIKILPRPIQAPSMTAPDEGESMQKTFTFNEFAHEIEITGLDETWTKYTISSSLSSAKMTVVSYESGTLRLSATNAATYTITASLKVADSMLWNDETGGNRNRVFTVVINKGTLETPYIVGHEADKTNTVKTIAFADADHTISIANVPDGYVAIGAQTGLTQRSYENGVITFEAPTAGSFTITVTPKPANDWMWETGNSDTIQFTFAIGDARIATPVYEGGTATTATAEYDAKWHEVKIAIDSNGLVQYTVTCDTAGQMDGAYAVQEVSWEYNVLTLRFMNYGVYTITFSHINSDNSKWANLSGAAATNARSLTYSITRKYFTAPNLEGKAVTVTSVSTGYTGQKVQFTFENLPKLQDEVGNDLFTVTMSDGMSIVSWENGTLVVEALNTKAYTVTLGNMNTYNTRWEVVGSSTTRPASRAYTLSIDRALYTTPNIQGKEVGTFTASAQYNGQYHEFVIENIPTTQDIDGNNLFTVLHSGAPIPTTGTGGLELVSWENNTLTVRAVNYGSYAVVLGQANTDNTRWAAYGNTSAGNGRTFTFSITMGYYNQPVLVGAATNAITYSTPYTGSYQTFVMTGVLNTKDVFGNPMFTVDDMPAGMTVVSWENDTLTLSARIATSYAITVRNANNGDNSRWIRPDSTSTPAARTYTITITNKYINFPVIQGTKDSETQRVTYTYNTQYQQLIITGVINDKDMDGNTFIIVDQSTLPTGLEFVSWENDTLILQAKNAGTYAFSLKLADPASVRWYRLSNSTTYTTDRTYTIVINKAGVPTPNRSVTSARYNFNGQKQQFSIRNVEKGLISYTYGTFPMEEASWTSSTDSDPNVLTVQASDIGAYTILVSLADPSNYYWIGRTSYISTYTYSYSVTINKYQQVYPKYKDTTSLNKSVVYNGGYQEFTFVNVFKDWNKYTPSGMEEVSWDDDGTLVLRAKNVGTYSPKIELIDPLNGKYINTSGYTYGTERQFTIHITAKSFTTTINFVSSNSDIQAQINANNLQWPAGVDVAASITFDGVVEPDYPNIEVYYYQDSTVTYPLERDEEDGLYHLPKKLSYGYWRVGVRTATDGSVNNYKQSKTTVTKQFLINTAFAPFSDSENNPKAPHEYLLWQYSNSKIAGGAKQIIEHNDDGTLKYGTQENPLELEYNGEAFSFSIAKTKAELQNLGVKLSSYSGNTSATNYKDDLYCAKVTMAAYSTKYYYTTTTYEFYYKINRVKVDLSGIKWAYSSPFTYDGSAKSIYLDAASIPKGLAVKQYVGNGQLNATEGQTNEDGSALKYTTRVVFTVVNDSYYLPDENDTNSYINGTNGKTFVWSCDWEINKATVNVKWTTGNYNVEGEGVYKVPVLANGASLVDYTYQTLQEDGSWVDGIQKIPHTEASCNVTASLKDEYTRNYNLVVNTEAHPNPVDFKIGKDQVPVQVGAEVNGVLITEGEGGVTSNLFPYTGSAYVAVPVVLGGDLTVNDYTVTYFTQTSINGTKTAPKDVGTYRVVIDIKYGSKNPNESDYYIDGKNEYEFTILKANFDTEGLKWQCTHGGAVIGYFDKRQNKWIDNATGREMLPFAYDGKSFTLTLGGINDIPGLTAKVSGNSYTNAGSYQAHVDFTYNTTNYNTPNFDTDFDWVIDKGTLDMTNVVWNYDKAFVYDYVNGKSVAYTVQLLNLPEYLKNKVTYMTGAKNEEMNEDGEMIITMLNPAAGNSASIVGEYLTAFTIGAIDTDNYYDIILPENLVQQLEWEITPKYLEIPVYEFEMGEEDTEEKAAWTFDNKSHALMLLLTMQSDWEKYYTVSVSYATDGVTFTDYAGYNGSKYAAIYAGVYKLTFSIKDGMNPDPKNPNIVWANGRATDRFVRVLVAKATLTVTGWNEAAESSTVNVKEGEGFANVFTYRYKDAAERVVPLNYILNSTGGETFYIEPIVKDEFASSVELAFESDSLATYAFTTPEPEEPDPEDPDAEIIAWFEKPTPEKLTIEFDNEAHTLSPESWLSDWSRYSDYLEVFALDSDSFTQTNIGSYKATLRFKSGAKASWKTESEAIKDLSVLVLEWEIVIRKIEAPVFEDKTYTDAEIDIFEEIKETYGDFVNVVSGNKGKNAGDYLLVLSLKYPGNSSWADGSFEDVNVKWTIKPAPIEIPQIDAEKQAALRFNRTEHSVTEALANYLEGVMVVALDGSYGTDAGDYTAHFSLVSSNYVWNEHDGDTVDVDWKILRLVVEKPTIDSDTQIVYDGEVHRVTDILSDYDAINSVISSGDISATNAGNYSFVISLPGDNFVWADDTTKPLTLNWKIDQRKFRPPVNDGSWKVFDNANHDLSTICGFEGDWKDYITVTVTYSNGGIATQAEEKNPLIGYNAGTYTMSFAIKPAFNETTNNVVWANGETAAREVTVEVEKLELNVTGWNKDQENSTVRLDSGSVPEDMVEYRFRNEEGDIVTMGEVISADDDTKFTIELIVKPEFANNVVVNYAHESIESYTFTKGQDDNSPEQLAKPNFERDTLEFSGAEQTFVIRNWSFYELYLEIKDGSDSLTQTEIGDYSVTLVIKENANAVWLDGSEEVTLSFHITEASAKYLKLTSTSKYVFLYEKEEGGNRVRRAYAQDSLIHGENDLELGFERFVLGQIGAGTTIEAFLNNLDQSLLPFIRLYDQTNRLVYDRENGLTALFKNLANKAFFAVGTGWRIEFGKDGDTPTDTVYLSILGDLNGDGFVNALDVSLANAYIATGDPFEHVDVRLAGSVSGNCAVSETDCELLFDIIMGKTSASDFYYQP